MAPLELKKSYEKQKNDFRKILIENGAIIKTACRASGIHIYMIDYVAQRITLETKLNAETTVEKYQWDIGASSVAAAEVVMTGRVVLCDQVIGEDLFPSGIPWRPRAQSAMCLPVISQDTACLGILELYREEKDDPFTVDDLSIANVILGWMCAHLSHSSLGDGSLQSKEELLRIHDEVLQEMMAYVSEDIAGGDMICRTLAKIKCSMNADYIRFCERTDDNGGSTPETCYLYDDGVNIFGKRLIAKKNAKFRFSRELCPLWNAAVEQKPINLEFPCLDPEFSEIGNFYKGATTKSLLAYPLPPEGAIRGALAVVNKVNGPRFTLNDEIVCDIWMKCLGVVSYLTFKQSVLEETVFKRKMVENIIFVKCSASESDIEKSISCYRKLRVPKDFFGFKWFPSDGKNMFELCVYMLKDMLEPQLAANDPLVFQFTNMVRESYRALPYHNFQHAVVVMHCAYIILKRNRKLFDQIEVSAIMISAICHDADHPGCTNSYLVTINHPLSKLYGKSNLEFHHYHLTECVIRELKLFQHLDSLDYRRLINDIRNNIIGTDSAAFLERKRTILKLRKSNTFQLNNEKHRLLMKSLIMTACDLSANCKPFPVARINTDNLLEEFYAQGDKEKMLGLCPAGMMNRDLYSRLPEEEVNFYAAVVLPCYSMLVQIVPNTEPLYYGGLKAWWQWQIEVEKKNEPMWIVEESYLSTE